MCCPRGEESMSSGLRIRATGGMQNVGTIPKAGCAGGTSGNVLKGNTDGFLGGLT